MQSIECYKKIENPDIGDSAEGMDEITQKPDITLFIPKLNFEWKIKTAETFAVGRCKPNLHIYCLTGITDSYCQAKANANKQVLLNPCDFGKFGDTVCVIKSTAEFHKRFEKACQSLGYKLVGPEKVIYYNYTDYSGVLSPIHKRDKYRHQEEFRYFVESDDENPICVKLGSLDDIADLYSIDGKSII